MNQSWALTQTITAQSSGRCGFDLCKTLTGVKIIKIITTNRLCCSSPCQCSPLIISCMKFDVKSCIRSWPVLAFFLVSLLIQCTCWSWENASFLQYEACCVLWVMWPSYLRQYLKEFYRYCATTKVIRYQNKQSCMSSHWHGCTWLLDPNTFRARSCWQKTQSGSHRAVCTLTSPLKDMTVHLMHTPIHTLHGNASESANGGDDESSRPAENLHGETCWCFDILQIRSRHQEFAFGFIFNLVCCGNCVFQSVFNSL